MIMQKILSVVNKIKEKAQKGQSIVEYGILITAVIAAVVSVSTNWNIDEKLTSIQGKINAQFEAADGATK